MSMTNPLPLPAPAGAFAAWLKALRQAADLTQEALAARLGCSVDTLSRVETGARPSRHFLEQLLAHLALPPQERTAFVEWARAETPPEDPLAPAPLPSLGQAGGLPRPLTALIGRDHE